MSSTQELSQWVIPEHNDPSRDVHTQTYTPRQSGYVDLDFVPPEHETQPDITPQIETRIEQFPESRRFVQPETPVPGGRNALLYRSSSGTDTQAPELPANPFGNPFGPDHSIENGGMGLTQVFQATQAGSSPTLLRRQQLPSSQRPSPNVTTRDAFDLPSDINSEQSPGNSDLKEFIHIPDQSSPLDSISSQTSHSSRKRGHVDDDELSPDGGEGVTDQEEEKTSKKRRLIVEHQSPAPVSLHGANARMLRSIRRGNTQQEAELSMVKDNGNISEDETEHEEEIEDPADIQLDDSEGNKENRHVNHNRLPRPGLQVKRAPRATVNQVIPLSSSPAVVRHEAQAEIEEGNPTEQPPALREPIQQFAIPEDNQDIAIADSQSSQQNTKQGQVKNQHQHIASSNDSRKVIPQSQAVRPPSSLHMSSMAPKFVTSKSQQTASPPDSSSGRQLHNETMGAQSHNGDANVTDAQAPVSPKSSPPPLDRDQENLVFATQADEVVDEENDHVMDDAYGGMGFARTQPAMLVGRTPVTRSTRHASAVPETTYNNRLGDALSFSGLGTSKDAFAAAENLEFSFHGPSQLDENNDSGPKSLVESFGRQPSANIIDSPTRRTPLKPRTFASIGVDQSQNESQEPESLDHGLWSTQDNELREAMRGSSPIAAGRKRRRGNNRQPILLDDVSSDTAPVLPDTGSQNRDSSPPAPRTIIDDDQEDLLQLEEMVEPNEPEGLPDAEGTSAEAIEEAIPFLESRIPSRQYGKKTKTVKSKRQTRSLPSTEHDASVSTVPRKRGRPRKNSSMSVPATAPVKPIPSTTIETRKRGQPQPSSTLPALASASVDQAQSTAPGRAKRGRRPKKPVVQASSAKTADQSIPDKTGVTPSTSRSSRRGTMATIYASARTEQSPVIDTRTLTINTEGVLFPRRVFAKFQGSPSGHFAATCLSCFEDEHEKKYQVRFDDGSVAQLGQTFVKRLEFHPGDEVRVYQSRLQSTTFIVQAFGSDMMTQSLADSAFPKTDIYGHTTVKLVEKSSPKGKSSLAQAKELEIPVTDVYFAVGAWPAVKNREYSHQVVELEPTRTPLVSKPTSTANSPQSRTRSTNKIHVPGFITSAFGAQVVGDVSPLLAESDLFKNIVFVVTDVGNPEREKLIKTIVRQDGTPLEDFKELFDLPGSRSAKNEDGDERDDVAAIESRTGRIQLKPKYADIKLAVLLTTHENRNTKYFQALALGVPCLSKRWVEDCIRSGKLKNWRPYLLAAGVSALLGEDILSSQQLNFTRQEIEDCTLTLATMLDRRNQWLRDARILIVGTGENGSRTKLDAHMFIAWVLGASEVVLAESPKYSEQYLALSKQGFDWICIDNEKEKDKSGGRSDRRTKRYSGLDKSLLQSVKGQENAKVIGTHLVLSSLIAGCLLDQEDMKD